MPKSNTKNAVKETRTPCPSNTGEEKNKGVMFVAIKEQNLQSQ